MWDLLKICFFIGIEGIFFFGDFKESDLQLPERRRRFWKVANQTKYKKMNEYYQCKIIRLKQKIKNLNGLIDELTKSKKLLSDQSFILKVN